MLESLAESGLQSRVPADRFAQIIGREGVLVGQQLVDPDHEAHATPVGGAVRLTAAIRVDGRRIVHLRAR